MTEPEPSYLAERALTRLRKIASGNGMEPASIALIDVQEDIFMLDGLLQVTPMVETEPTSYAGGVRNKSSKTVGKFADLVAAVAQHKQKFTEDPHWTQAVLREVGTHEHQGWGLENAKVTLPEQSAVYAATETCPSCEGRQILTCTQCQGSGDVICTQCQGQGREQCYNCGGRGEEPQQPGQQCRLCNGTRMAPCRYCQSRGRLSCPTCNGRRGTPCTTCQGLGKLTQEISVTCGAETHFKLQAKDLPSGLRRGLDRVGIANLGKGHADITAQPIPEDENEPPPTRGLIPILTYRAALPYAEMRVTIGAKKAVISAFGKRCILMGVPVFLDEITKPWRDRLRQAMLGRAALEPALEIRAMKELLALTVAGKTRIEDARKLYPVGFSNDALQSIMTDMRLALKQATLKTRTIIAAACVGASAILFYGLLMTGWLAQQTQTLKTIAAMAIYALCPVLAMAASWAIVNATTLTALKKRFPNLKIPFQQKIGKTGFVMLACVLAVFVILLFLSPRPPWLALPAGLSR